MKRSRALNNQGNMALNYINDSANVVYLANMHTSEFLFLFFFFRYFILYFYYLGELINVGSTDREGRIKPKRRFSLREGNRSTRT